MTVGSLNLLVSELTNNPDIELPNSFFLLSDDQFNYNTPNSHDIIGYIVKESSDIDHSKEHQISHPNPTNLNFNENPEDENAYLDYEGSTANGMSDHAVSN